MPSTSGIWKSSSAASNFPRPSSSRASAAEAATTGTAAHSRSWSFEDASVRRVVVDHQDAAAGDAAFLLREVEAAEAGRGGHLDGEGKGGAFSRLALHPHVSPHQDGHALADGEAEAGAPVAAGGGAVDLLERFEEAGKGLGGDADAGVGDGE